jgi:2-polyprenyl-3-methyl-5-hydroxy-6-metoxy-1,4-benzoquinol methylase
VNFTEQEKYLKRGRAWSAVCVVCTVAAAVYAWKLSGITARMPVIICALVVATLCGSLFYTPDYLHLNVNLNKRMRWQIKIRWRLLGVGLIFGLASASNVRDVIVVIAVIAWLAAANSLAKSVASPPNASIYFGATDCLAVAYLLFATQINPLLAVAIIMASAHLEIVSWENLGQWTGFVAAFWCVQLISVGQRNYTSGRITVSYFGIILASAVSTFILVARAQRQNARNVSAVLSELEEFTSYSADKIRNMWADSNQLLAMKWQAAEIPEDDREKMTAWYRENSELYMFAISGYNLEYKRIRDSIKMLKLGRGACLDYGAGNGEIILELARRGHAAIYFDVDGTSMRFARHRAERQKLAVEFFHSKDDLAASAKRRGLDTIFSFDVLEHLPDLPGELKFLSSLLNPGGRMAFDVPAGSTKAHPMHLNHHLDIHAHMESIGMTEKRGLMESIPFRKQEKYVFRKPA